MRDNATACDVNLPSIYMEAESYGEILHTRNVQEGLRAFFDRRKPDFTGQ
jgi:hypothetical protein